jgi:hypothetical protein
MGIGIKDIGRGAAAGLATLGSGLRRQRQEEEEQKRYETEQEMKERELKLREDEAAQRKEKLRLENLITKSQIAHGNLKKTAMASGYASKETGYGAPAMAEALTKYLPDGLAYQFDGYAEDTGLPKLTLGTYATDDATGKVKADPGTGKPKFIPLYGEDTKRSQKVFKSEQEWVNFIDSNLNPDWLVAVHADDRSYEKTRSRVKDQIADEVAKAEAVAGTKKGKSDIDKTKAQTRKLDAETAALEREAKNPQSSKIQQMSAKELAADLRDSYPGEPITPELANQMARVRTDPKVRKAFSEAIAKALDPESGYSQAQFIKDGIDVGMPKAFMEMLYQQGVEMSELDREALGSDGWFKKVFDGFMENIK